jgi:hypothetical protein
LLAAACACVLELRRRHWIVAGIFAAVASTARPNGVALIACCAFEAFIAIRSRREWGSLWAVILAPTGIVAWFAYLKASTGSVAAWFQTERGGWNERESLTAIMRLIHAVARDGLTNPNFYVPLFATGVAALLVIMLIQAKPPGVLLVYTAVVLAMALMSTTLNLRPRFLLTAFPLVMVLGYRLKGNLYALTLAGSAVLMMGLLIVSISTTLLVP